MKAALLCAALGLVVLPVAARASAEHQATLEAALPPASAGAPAAVDLHMTWADPGEPAAKPQPVRRLVLAFPAGTRIDTSALPRCTATNRQLTKAGPAACPKATRVGTGKSILNTGAQLLRPSVTLINARREIIVVVRLGKSTLAVYRDDVAGSSVTVNFALPPQLSLQDLRIHIPVHAEGRRVYFRAPPSCPPEGWSMTATSTYADASAQQAAASVPCRTSA